jgi:hypothetical protein
MLLGHDQLPVYQVESLIDQVPVTDVDIPHVHALPLVKKCIGESAAFSSVTGRVRCSFACLQANVVTTIASTDT